MAELIVRKTIYISAPPLKVWSTITSPSAIRRWMLVEPALESDGPLQLGDRIRWNDDHGKTYLTGTVVTLDPLQKLVLALEDIGWQRKARPEEVTYALALSESDGGSRLAFMLGDLAIDPQGQQWFDAYSASEELAIIKAMVEGPAMSRIDTRCLCGAIHLRIHHQPLAQFYCHCDDCQAVHGASYVGIAVFPSDAVEVIRGAPISWTYKTLPRQRCSSCGTLLIARVPDSELTGVKANLLPPGMFTPAFHIHCQFAVLPVVDDLPHYSSLPGVFGGTDDVVAW